MEIDQEYISDLLHRAGELAHRSRKELKIRKKGRGDYVTETDMAVQRMVRAALLERYPDIGFVGEESEPDRVIRERERPIPSPASMPPEAKWILDPIDGTMNYIYDYRLSAISLGLCRQRDGGGEEICFGAIYNPFTGEYFHAVKGEGAFLNGEPIHVNEAVELTEALVAVGTSPYYKELVDKVFAGIIAVQREALDIRRGGSAALDLAYVACGRQDAYFEYRLKPWDLAAGILLVEEAGGAVGPLEGEISFEQPSDLAAACSSKLLEQVVRACNRA